MKRYILYIKNYINKMRFTEKSKYIINIILSNFSYFFTKRTYKKEIWVIGAGDDIFSNNCKVFYQYIDKMSSVDIYWIANKSSIERLKKHISVDRIVERGSIENYILVRKCKVAVYGFSDYDVAPGFFRLRKRKNITLVNISHGFDGLKGMDKNYYRNIPADVICAVSEFERQVKINRCGAEYSKVRVTGFPRYDKFEVKNIKKIKKILVIPTWRDWYNKEIQWTSTELYKQYSLLFGKIGHIVKENNLEIKYVLHPAMYKKIDTRTLFDFEYITFVDKHEEIQKLINESDMLISDYSSIMWDFIYMKKPVALFWHDFDTYVKERGILVERDFFPYIFYKVDEVIEFIIRNLEGNILNDYERDKYFDWVDQNNCWRVYNTIVNF